MATLFISKHHGPKPAEFFLARVNRGWIVAEPAPHGTGWVSYVGRFALGRELGAHAAAAATLPAFGATVFASRGAARAALARAYPVAQ